MTLLAAAPATLAAAHLVHAPDERAGRRCRVRRSAAGHASTGTAPRSHRRGGRRGPSAQPGRPIGERGQATPTVAAGPGLLPSSRSGWRASRSPPASGPLPQMVVNTARYTGWTRVAIWHKRVVLPSHLELAMRRPSSAGSPHGRGRRYGRSARDRCRPQALSADMTAGHGHGCRGSDSRMAADRPLTDRPCVEVAAANALARRTRARCRLLATSDGAVGLVPPGAAVRD